MRQQRWKPTEEEIAAIRLMSKQGLTVRLTARRIGRTYHQVVSLSRKLKIGFNPTGVRRKAYRMDLSCVAERIAIMRGMKFEDTQEGGDGLLKDFALDEFDRRCERELA